ncbi:hypothetical protein D3C86_1821770 [compost metagenome]
MMAGYKAWHSIAQVSAMKATIIMTALTSTIQTVPSIDQSVHLAVKMVKSTHQRRSLSVVKISCTSPTMAMIEYLFLSLTVHLSLILGSMALVTANYATLRLWRLMNTTISTSLTAIGVSKSLLKLAYL